MEIIFNNVTVIKNKGTNFKKTVLKKVNLKFETGVITAISGCGGKSTLGKTIIALEDISSGSIKVGKFVIKKTSNFKNINDLRFLVGYLFSDPNDYLYKKTVADEIEFGMKYYKYKLDTIKNRVADALRIVGLNESYLKRNPLELSYVEQKKVMLASVLAFNPEVIILDEFEKGLTKNDKKILYQLLKTLKKKFNKTIIVISNDISFISAFCEKIYLIDSGEVVLEEDIKTLNYDDLYEYLEMPKITEFIKYINSLGRKFKEYNDIRELIKAVYRNAK